jgi:hypothetical protein
VLPKVITRLPRNGNIHAADAVFINSMAGFRITLALALCALVRLCAPAAAAGGCPKPSDLHIAFGLNRNAPSWIAGVGYSFRLDGVFAPGR